MSITYTEISSKEDRQAVISYINELLSGYTDNNGLRMDPIMSDDIKTWDTDEIKMIGAAIGRRTDSSQYGYILGFYRYDDRFYEFRYTVHTPNQRFPHLSNKMTNLKKIMKETIRYTKKDGKEQECEGFYPSDTHVENDLHEAFLLHHPIESLTKNGKELKTLMKNITAWSRNKDLCRQFRKTDKERIAYIENTGKTHGGK